MTLARYRDADDPLISALGFPSAQVLLSHGAPEKGSEQRALCGWHGTIADARVGSFALVRTGGPLADRVGERLKIRAHGVVDSVVYVYVYREADIEEDISITRRAFMALAPLGQGSVEVVVENMVGEESPLGPQVAIPTNARRNPLNYVNADPTDNAVLQIAPDGAMSVEPRISLSVHNEFTYGFLYGPSFGHGPNVRVVQKYWSGSGNNGNLDHTRNTDVRWSPQVGSCVKWADAWGTASTTLNGNQVYNYGDPSLTVHDTSGSPASGTIKVTSGAFQLHLRYASKTGTTFDGLTPGDYGTNDYGATFLDGSAVTSDYDINLSRGIFSWWNMEDGSLGIYYANGVGGSQEFGYAPLSDNTEDVFVDVGAIGWQGVLAADWTAPDPAITTGPVGGQLITAGLASLEVASTALFPATGKILLLDASSYTKFTYTGKDATHFTGLTYVEGQTGYNVAVGHPAYVYMDVAPPVLAPGHSVPGAGVFVPPPNQAPFFARIYPAAGDPTDIGSGTGTGPWQGVEFRGLEGDGNTLKGAVWRSGQGRGAPRVYPAGSKVVAASWFGCPLEAGYSFNSRTVTGAVHSYFYPDTPGPLDGSYNYGGFFGTIHPNTFYWTVMEVVGNSLRWEVWDHDPVTGGTYLARLRIEFHSAAAIGAFGAAALGGCGPFGLCNPLPTSYVADWSFT